RWYLFQLPTSRLPYTTLFRSGCDVRREVIAERGAQNVVLNDCAGVGRASGAEAVVAAKEILAVPVAAPRQATSEGALRDVRRGKDRKSTRLNSNHVKISHAVF